MCRNHNELLEEIQEKREKMINSAQKSGFTSEDTIRYSQELDKLIFEYQCTFGKHNRRAEEVRELKYIYKHMMLIWPKALVNV
ncbi:aspartyl-phosphate phosphatase Spo0E family protein [Bacillus sp. 31A1R]|uniref:Aspartyl-phosphate phosphatase Spo0E family protein n=1 Tax=Robertmurraya mangrovi TaxID=3098077 RepID=A0ABU5ITQ3_9BACI|nr:aspartyl-phosphate phosphatase Spo0E family protein [Bacillus sp. 31A1R]MDZ5470540.1 aspartyl-phosphate phosphatase Spo0E family protein [Bacillus sp. 31A1R]